MNEMKISYIFKAWPDTELLRDCSKEELSLLVLLYTQGAQDEQTLAEALSLRAARVSGALRFLVEEGLAEMAENGVVAEPSLHPSDDLFEARGGAAVAATIRDHALAALLEECAALLKKPVLERWEIEQITALYEQYGLGEEFIVSLFADMRSRSACSVKALVNRAIGLHKQGIDSHEALMRYFENREEKGEFERSVRRIFGSYGRSLSDAEREMFTRWTEEFGFGEEMIKLAYSRAVIRSGASGKVPYEYINSVLEGWFNEGIRTPEAADAADAAYKAKHAGEKNSAEDAAPRRTRQKAPQYGSFDTMDAFQRALERSYGAESEDENK